VNNLGLVNQPPWHIKAVIIAVFSIPAVIFLLLGAFFRGFSHTRRDTGIVLLSASAFSALAMLSFFCVWAFSRHGEAFFCRHISFFSDTVSGIVCLSLYVLIGFALLFIPHQSA
jgi:hypothetical protein